MSNHHQYSINQSDAMVAFYDQESFRQQFYSGIYQTTTEHNHQQPDKQTEQYVGFNTHHIPEVEFSCPKTWIDHHEQQQLQQQQVLVNDNNVMGCGELQSLSLSMSPGSHESSCISTSSRQQISHTNTTDCVPKKRGPDKMGHKPTVHRKCIDTFGQRTSQYRGVTR